jgi:hypothetical protein
MTEDAQPARLRGIQREGVYDRVERHGPTCRPREGSDSKVSANATGVTLLDVVNWVSDLAQPHDDALVLFAALEIVASGPLLYQQRLIRNTMPTHRLRTGETQCRHFQPGPFVAPASS